MNQSEFGKWCDRADSCKKCLTACIFAILFFLVIPFSPRVATWSYSFVAIPLLIVAAIVSAIVREEAQKKIGTASLSITPVQGD